MDRKSTQRPHAGTNRRLLAVLAAICTLAGTSSLFAQDVLRLTRNVAGDSKPVVLYADEITTWTEGQQRVFLLKGKVLIEHGVVHARMQQAVAVADQAGFRKTGVMHVQVYGEGEVQLQNPPESKTGPRALLDLHTRGEVRIKSYLNRVQQQPRRDDPLFQKLQLARTPPASNPIQRTSAQQPSTPPLRPNVTPPTPPLVAPPPSDPYPSPSPPPGSQPPVAPPGEVTPPPVAPPVATPGAPPAPGPPPKNAPQAGTPGPPRQFSIQPRTGRDYDSQTFTLPNGEQAVVFTGGIILNVRNVQSIGLLDIEADRLVIWFKGNSRDFVQGLRSPQGQNGQELEFFLSGNVEIRQQSTNARDTRTLRADEVYYDVGRNVAVALRADLEIKERRFPEPIHIKAEELLQLSANEFKAVRAEIFSSHLPSDPGLKVYLHEATVEQRTVPRRSIFGGAVTDRRTGQPASEPQLLVRGVNAFLKIEDLPIFYLPYLQGDARDPLGPLESVGFNYNRMFGFQTLTSWNLYDLLGIDPVPGTRWRLDADYLSRRGPALGTSFDYAGKEFFGLPSTYVGLIKAYGLYDRGPDLLGFLRDDQPHTKWRGRFLWRQAVYDLPAGFTVQSQLAGLSDKNFLEQYFKIEFDQDLNQETYLYVKQQQNHWAWTGLVEPRLRNWVTETEWLPRADGYLLGQSLFEWFSYSAHVSAGYAQLKPTHVPPPPVLPTDARVDAGRFDLFQELSVPFTLGPLRLAPYGVLDLAYYTRDLTGNEEARIHGGGGLRGSLPLSRLYPDVESELLNLNGLHHKMVLSANYAWLRSDTPFRRLPQLDRLDDDATDQARRDVFPAQKFINKKNATFLTTSPLFDPQVYAIRRLVLNRIDTLDTVEVVQLDLRQRLQTKRGFPGQQHIVDWMTLDLSASWFPDADRDNFSESFAFLEYDWIWNVGDRTALVSSGWVDPIDGGPRQYTVGASFDRPDRTNFFLGYRQTDPIQSKAVLAAVTYVFSPKYAMTAGTMYDFGTDKSLSNQLVLTRMGSDLSLSFGITYNALQNNFGVLLEILPNVVPITRRQPGAAAIGSAQFQQR